ncbi:MAG: hypothetical protein Ta2E_02620 [Mycoplasmoidaceae bacterium]|nr:MAG: hypothetical protein Ta2E_02620 [Mycoplasmoidaceae bacterium]
MAKDKIFKHNMGKIFWDIKLHEDEKNPILITSDPKNVIHDVKSVPNFCLRKRVYNMLVDAFQYLPKGCKFKVFEAYRPMEEQIRKWNETEVEMKNKHPNLKGQKLIDLMEVYIANPYTIGSGHQTGASIDLTIYDTITKKEYDMGGKWRENSEATMTYCTKLTPLQTRNRLILLNAMLRAGFTNYYEEWWHFCWGEQEWAIMTRNEGTHFLKLKK